MMRRYSHEAERAGKKKTEERRQEGEQTDSKIGIGGLSNDVSFRDGLGS